MNRDDFSFKYKASSVYYHKMNAGHYKTVRVTACPTYHLTLRLYILLAGGYGHRSRAM